MTTGAVVGSTMLPATGVTVDAPAISAPPVAPEDETQPDEHDDDEGDPDDAPDRRRLDRRADGHVVVRVVAARRHRDDVVAGDRVPGGGDRRHDVHRLPDVDARDLLWVERDVPVTRSGRAELDVRERRRAAVGEDDRHL